MTSKAEVWQERLAACRESGLSTAAFCRSHDLPYAQFMYWQRRLGGMQKGLVPVRVEAPTQAALSLDLALPCGVTVSVRGAVGDDVVAILRALSC